MTSTKNLIDSGKSVIVSDIQFCKSDVLKNWVNQNVPNGIMVEYIYFSNEPEKCKNNAIRRNGRELKRQLELIEEYTKNYNPVNPVLVWMGDKI